MIQIVCTEIDLTTPNFDHIRNIHFDLDGGKKFDYRARVSYDAFARGPKDRCYKKVDGKRVMLYYCRHEQEFNITNNINKKFNIEPAPDVYVNTLWDFYKEIGYDYKTKKYAGR